jgi:hypothetical protein
MQQQNAKAAKLKIILLICFLLLIIVFLFLGKKEDLSHKLNACENMLVYYKAQLNFTI